MKKRYLLSGFLSLGLLLTMISCGKPQDTTPTSSDTESETSEVSTEVSIDYGTVTINDIEVTFMNEVIINPVFEKERNGEKII